jgi:pimeloyl-ACP methyl ester carboxylesterase
MTIDLSFERVEGVRPDRVMAFLHGVLGRGRNLRALARRFVDELPRCDAWLVDLRGHGESPKGTPAPSLEAAAEDIVLLAKQSAVPWRAILGHSFGGKVALEAARLGGMDSLEHLFVIDSMPGARTPVRGGDSALTILDHLSPLPESFASVSAFVAALEAAGITRELGQWLAGSLVRDGDRLRFSLVIDEIRALLLNYFARDLWPVVEHPPHGVSIHLVIGDHSGTYSQADRERAAQIAAANRQVTVDVLPAGHLVHVEDPEGLLGVLRSRMGEWRS